MSQCSRVRTVLLLLLLAGCSGTSLPPNAAANRAMTNSSGGAFTGSSSGGYTFLGCTASANGYLKFRGGGHASYLGYDSESGKMRGQRFGSRCVWSGSATLTSRHRGHSSVTFGLSLKGSRHRNPCGDAVSYVVKHGSGKFANASGYGTVTFDCSDSYLDEWSGTLSF